MTRRRRRFVLVFWLAVALGGAIAVASLTSGSTPAGARAATRVQEGADQASVRVAYPEAPVAWYAPLEGDPAAIDLGAVWGLPLYRIDAWGQLRPGLAVDAEVLPGAGGEPWIVDITLAEGTWSNGSPVTAGDVVATIDALREVRPDEFDALRSVTARDGRTVRFTFARPYARWPYLLAGGTSVLPADMIVESGLDAYRDDVPVSGGPFRLESFEPGLRAVFVAHPGSPLGAPGLERVEVYFTPSYETALGLLRDGRVDVVAGHLALNPVGRARRVDGVRAAAPVGGTWTVLEWRADGDLGDDPGARREARESVDLSRFVQGLLEPHGARMTSTIPGLDGPWRGSETVPGDPLTGESLLLFVPADEEAPAFTSRLLQGALAAQDATVEIGRLDSRLLYDLEDEEGDGAVLVRRDPPWPSLAAQVEGGADLEAELREADARVFDAEVVRRAQRVLHADATLLPLYRVAVAHAWREELSGIRASSWPGIAFWDVGAWRWEGPVPPREPPVRGTPVSPRP